MPHNVRSITLTLAILCACLCPASSAVIVRFSPLESVVSVGQQFQVQVRADITNPVLGWGLDVNHASQIIAGNGTPDIGPLWSPGYAPDGDALAGLAFPSSISGSNVLLATLTFSALNVGETYLTASITPGDLTEGFPLDPTGFDMVTFEPAHVTVVPEPASLLLISLNGLIVFRRRFLPVVAPGV